MQADVILVVAESRLIDQAGKLIPLVDSSKFEMTRLVEGAGVQLIIAR